MLKKFKHSKFFFSSCLVAYIATVPVATVFANENPTLAIRNDDTEIVFIGRCPNGNSYRIFSYQKEIDGSTQSFYDYEGPAGKGTVRTNIQPKKMLARLCRDLADINDGSKFD